MTNKIAVRNDPLDHIIAFQLLRFREVEVLRAVMNCFKEKDGTFYEGDIRNYIGKSAAYVSNALVVLIKLGLLKRYNRSVPAQKRWVYTPHKERLVEVHELLESFEDFGLKRWSRSIMGLVFLSNQLGRPLVVADKASILSGNLVLKEIQKPDGYLEAEIKGQTYHYSPSKDALAAAAGWDKLSALFNDWWPLD